MLSHVPCVSLPRFQIVSGSLEGYFESSFPPLLLMERPSCCNTACRSQRPAAPPTHRPSPAGTVRNGSARSQQGSAGCATQARLRESVLSGRSSSNCGCSLGGFSSGPSDGKQSGNELSLRAISRSSSRDFRVRSVDLDALLPEVGEDLRYYQVLACSGPGTSNTDLACVR